jgi:hypothetical protein
LLKWGGSGGRPLLRRLHGRLRRTFHGRPGAGSRVYRGGRFPMAWRILVVALVVSAVHAGDELTEAARRDRVSRLRARAVTWYATRKGVRGYCTRCEGEGWVKKEFGERDLCPVCDGSSNDVNEGQFRKAFFEMMTPRYRSAPGREEEIKAALIDAAFHEKRPAALFAWTIDRVELADASHGVVWTKLNGEKDPTPMRWIRTDDANGKPEWFVYDEKADGPWPGEEAEEIDWDAWDIRANEACAKATTSLAKVDALKALAAKVVVVETVKIVDVTPYGEGAKIVVCQLWGGPWRSSVEVGKDQLALVREWGKWDRLTWRLRVVVGGPEHNDIRGEVLWEGPKSAKWSKNTGLGGYRIDPTDPASFPEWCAKFDAADAAGRREMVRKMQGKTFVDEAKVVEIVGPNAQVVFKNGEKLSVPLEDPQAMEEVGIGDTISVARTAWLVGTEETFTDRGKLMFRLGILARKPGGS